jgi:hypothetical protein
LPFVQQPLSVPVLLLPLPLHLLPFAQLLLSLQQTSEHPGHQSPV